MRSTAGYSLIELLIVIVVSAIILSAIAVNIIPAVVSLDIENVAAQTADAISRVRREALKGSRTPAEFRLKDAAAGRRSGITATERAPASSNDCSNGCASGEQSICVSGIAFCYRESAGFAFERSSGRLDSGHAVFILSKSRKFALLISRDGKTDAAELVNGQWKARSELLNQNAKR